MDAMMKAQQLRQLQLENQAAQQRLQQQASPAVATTPTAAPAQRPDNFRTLGFLNGRTWNAANADAKLSYISGLSEMLLLTPGADVFRYVGKSLTIVENSRAIDRFYEDPENLFIPVPFAMQIVAMRSNGDSLNSIENFTATVRRTILDLQSKSPQ